MKIVVASNNMHKVTEYKEILKDFDVEILTMKDVNAVGEAEEDGDTFQENSLKKAMYLKQFTTLPIIADDSGLILEALPDLLGVHTARFLGHDTSYDIKRKEVIKRLEKLSKRAYFECCITLLNFDDDVHQFVGQTKGHIADEIKGNGGFGYDPIFIPDGYEYTFSELGEEIKNKISHRGKAGIKLIEFLKENSNENTID